MIQASILLISISLTLGWKKISGKCCWKISRGITILLGCVGTDLTNTLKKMWLRHKFNRFINMFD
jgi:hypothetical protein